MKHYVYKIVNVKTGSYYIGSRSSTIPAEDNYMGSSKVLSDLIKKEPKGTFIKEVLYEFSSRKEANNCESVLVEEALKKEPYKVYNKRIPGSAKVENQHNIRVDIWNDYYLDIRKKYIDGTSMRSLAKEYTCDARTIGQVVLDIKRKGERPDIWKKSVEICQDYVKGSSLKALAQLHTCDINTIIAVVEKQGITIRNYSEQYTLDKTLQQKRRRPLREFNVEYAIHLYVEKKLTMQEVSKQLGVYYNTIRKRFIELGVKIRSSAAVNKERKIRHSAWKHQREIQEDSKYLTKKALCEKYSIKDYSTLNKILLM